MKSKMRNLKKGEIQAVLPGDDGLAKFAGEWRKQKNGGEELLKWFDAMPEQAIDATKHVTISIPLELDVNAWLIYAKAAKVRKQTLTQVLTSILIEEDISFEERGYLTPIEKEDEERREAEGKK